MPNCLLASKTIVAPFSLSILKYRNEKTDRIRVPFKERTPDTTLIQGGKLVSIDQDPNGKEFVHSHLSRINDDFKAQSRFIQKVGILSFEQCKSYKGYPDIGLDRRQELIDEGLLDSFSYFVVSQKK